jgi:PAS domain S-box-containing protein
MNGEYAFIKVVSKTMRDNAKSKAKLLQEVETLRKRVTELEQCKDVTGRKKYEEEIGASEERFRDLAARSFDLIFMTNAQGYLTYISAASEKIFNYKPEEMVGTHFKNYLIKSEIPRVSQRFAENMKGKNLGNSRMEAMRKDGSHIFIELNSSPIVKNGETIGIQGIIRDITEHKRAEEALRESRRRFRSLVEVTSDWVWEVDQSGIYTYASPKIKELLGYEPQEVIGKTPFDFMLPSEAERVDGLFKDIIKSRKPFNCLENTNLHKDGREVVLETSGVPIFDEGGNLLGYRGIDRDITEGKKAEEALRESEKRFREIFENIAVGVYRTTPDGQILMANPALVHMLGYSSFEELRQRNLKEEGFEPQYERSTFKEEIEREGRIVSSESTWITRDGKTLHVIENARAVRDEDGKTLYYEGTAENITERKKAEEEIEKFKKMADRATFGYAMADLNGNLTYINESFAKMHGYAPAELIGKNLKIFHTAAQIKRVSQLNKRLVETGQNIRNEEVWHVHRDGTEFPTLMHDWVLKDPDGKPFLLCATAIDITEHKRAEEALRESEDKYRTLLENIPQKIFLKDRNSVYISCNENYAGNFKIKSEEIVGKTDYDFYPKELAEKYRADDKRIMESGGTVDIEEKYIQQGQEVVVHTVKTLVKDAHGNVIGILGVFWDITKHKKAEEELNEYREKMAQAERLASLGTLSATLAHELNQPLTAIRLSIENSLADLETTSSPDTVIEDLKDGLSAVSDVASKVDSLRNFAQESSKEIISEVNLKAVAERILDLLNESARRAGVSLHLKDMDKLPLIQSNEKDLEQLFFALVENAIQAADGKKECQLIISGDVKDEHIELRFSDTCGGIAPENLDRIFEPFFTTRPVGERTGLGLCIVERIVSGAGGKIRLESKAGKGSTFFVTLPISRGRMS